MMRPGFFILAALFLSSCATIFHGQYTTVNVFTTPDSIPVGFNKDTVVYHSPVQLRVARSDKPLHLQIGQDSISRSVRIPSKLSLAFVVGNIVNGSMPLGHLIDLSNSKRFTYPENVMIGQDKSIQPNLKYKTRVVPVRQYTPEAEVPVRERLAMKKGDWRLKMSVPEGNYFVIKQETGMGAAFGFLGITTGAEYVYRDNRFVGIGAGTLTDFLVPFPAPVDFMGEYDRSFGSYIDVFHGFAWHRFQIAYGLSLSRTTFEKWNTVGLFPVYESFPVYRGQEVGLGLSGSVAWRFTSYFQVGLKYIPSFYTVNPGSFRYGHLLFLDVAINYRFRKKQQL